MKEQGVRRGYRTLTRRIVAEYLRQVDVPLVERGFQVRQPRAFRLAPIILHRINLAHYLCQDEHCRRRSASQFMVPVEAWLTKPDGFAVTSHDPPWYWLVLWHEGLVCVRLPEFLVVLLLSCPRQSVLRSQESSALTVASGNVVS